MSARSQRILGSVDDPSYAGRRRDVVWIGWADATRRRLRRTSRDGLDVAVDLPRGSFLADGAVLVDDGTTIVVVARTPTPTLVVTIDETLPVTERVRAAALVAHAFGNQHVPIEVDGTTLKVPLTTSAEIARATVAGLGLRGLDAAVADVPVARQAPLGGSHASHGHDHGQS